MNRTANGYSLETSEAPGAQSASLSEQHAQTFKTLEKVFSAAQPGAAFSEPVVSGNYTVITACEVSSGGGIGYGGGTAPAPQAESEQSASKTPSVTGGSGGGGGGGAMTRPVAAIIIGPDGVRVEPIVDVTKLGLAGIALVVSFFAVFRGMRRGRRR